MYFVNKLIDYNCNQGCLVIELNYLTKNILKFLKFI